MSRSERHRRGAQQDLNSLKRYIIYVFGQTREKNLWYWALATPYNKQIQI